MATTSVLRVKIFCVMGNIFWKEADLFIVIFRKCFVIYYQCALCQLFFIRMNLVFPSILDLAALEVQPDIAAEDIKWALSRENLSSGYQRKQVSSNSRQRQRLARRLKFHL